MKLNTNTSVGLRLPKKLWSGGNVQKHQLIALNNKMRQNVRQGWKVLQNAPAYCA